MDDREGMPEKYWAEQRNTRQNREILGRAEKYWAEEANTNTFWGETRALDLGGKSRQLCCQGSKHTNTN